MASPEKKLGEFLKEQQEPFILEVYLLEKGCSRKLKRSDASSCFFKPLFPLSKVLTILHKKLHFQNRSKSALFRDPETRTEHAPHETVVELETDRFSTASSSTVFNSCSDVDEDGNSFWSHENNPLFSSDNFQVSSVYNMGVQRYEVEFEPNFWFTQILFCIKLNLSMISILIGFISLTNKASKLSTMEINTKDA